MQIVQRGRDRFAAYGHKHTPILCNFAAAALKPPARLGLPAPDFWVPPPPSCAIMLRLGLGVVHRTMWPGLGGRFLLRCTSAPREPLISRRPPAVTGVAHRAEIGPGQPQIRALADTQNVVHVGGRRAAATSSAKRVHR